MAWKDCSTPSSWHKNHQPNSEFRADGRHASGQGPSTKCDPSTDPVWQRCFEEVVAPQNVPNPRNHAPARGIGLGIFLILSRQTARVSVRPSPGGRLETRPPFGGWDGIGVRPSPEGTADSVSLPQIPFVILDVVFLPQCGELLLETNIPQLFFSGAPARTHPCFAKLPVCRIVVIGPPVRTFI